MRKGLAYHLAELWNFRELLFVLSWRDIKVRYQRTLLGIVWILFQPIIITVIFSLFFGKIAKVSFGTLPSPVFFYLGLSVWTFFANAVNVSSNSLFSNEGIIKKIYFPRIIIPLAAILTSIVDLLIILIFGVLLISFFHLAPDPLVFVLFPVFSAVLFLTVFGSGLIFSVLKVKYPDIRQAFPFFLQIGLFITPAIYSLEIISDWRKWVLALNPLAGIIEMLRSLVSNSVPNWTFLYLSVAVSVALFFLGIHLFYRNEDYLAELL